MAADSRESLKRPRAEVEDAAAPVMMINGLPGALAMESARACLRRGLSLAAVALTGPRGTKSATVQEGSKVVTIQLVGAADHEAQRRALKDAASAHGSRLVVVDCTHPDAVNRNAELYTTTRCAFVMGTTGGDRECLLELAEKSGTYAVIAANMCKQVVALQATMAMMASKFPGAFNGYSMEITESHQKTKVDTSGTAKDMVQSFQGLGLDVHEDQIRKLRDEVDQVSFGVPNDALNGHAFHTYTLKSGDGSVEFQIKHNICGRGTYGEGIADAAIFLAARVAEGSHKKLYDMMDVLGAGAMK